MSGHEKRRLRDDMVAIFKDLKGCWERIELFCPVLLLSRHQTSGFRFKKGNSDRAVAKDYSGMNLLTMK